MGIPLVIIHANRIFPNKNQPFWATPMTLESPTEKCPEHLIGIGDGTGKPGVLPVRG